MGDVDFDFDCDGFLRVVLHRWFFVLGVSPRIDHGLWVFFVFFFFFFGGFPHGKAPWHGGSLPVRESPCAKGRCRGRVRAHDVRVCAWFLIGRACVRAHVMRACVRVMRACVRGGVNTWLYCTMSDGEQVERGTILRVRVRARKSRVGAGACACACARGLAVGYGVGCVFVVAWDGIVPHLVLFCVSVWGRGIAWHAWQAWCRGCHGSRVVAYPMMVLFFGAFQKGFKKK